MPAILSNDWQIETAFRAEAEIAGRDRKISDTCRKGYSCPVGEEACTEKQRASDFSRTSFFSCFFYCLQKPGFFIRLFCDT